MESWIRLNSITKNYGRQRVLCDLDLTLAPGRFYTLLGANGAGKSTLMRILTQAEEPDSGTGFVLGHALSHTGGGMRRDLGAISESLEIALPTPVGRIFSTLGALYPRWSSERFFAELRAFGIAPDRPFSAFSRGQKIQILIAFHIATKPKILLLDEVTAVLDASARTRALGLLREFCNQGGLVLLATNIVSEVQNYADEVLLLQGGSWALRSPLKDLPEHFVRFRIPARASCPDALAAHSVEVGLNSDGSISHLAPQRLAATVRETAGVLPDQRHVSAEDAFIYFTRALARQKEAA
jgi:ABC-type multidrug transport system ATPase subunit